MAPSAVRQCVCVCLVWLCSCVAVRVPCCPPGGLQNLFARTHSTFFLPARHICCKFFQRFFICFYHLVCLMISVFRFCFFFFDSFYLLYLHGLCAHLSILASLATLSCQHLLLFFNSHVLLLLLLYVYALFLRALWLIL